MTYFQKANQARIKVLDMIHRGQTSHIASNFSVIDIATVLYDRISLDDEVVWSKGWVAATIYYFLAQQGKIPKDDLNKFPNDPYLGLAETKIPGVWVSGGSVGQGLPVAVGMALAKKRANEPGTIYCIMSDGELDEGTVWESVRIAASHKLNNLVAIVDANGWQAMGKTEDVNGGDIKAQFGGFGWSGIEIDGHDFENIEHALKIQSFKPHVIVANTIKGKGVSFMENHLTYHYKHVTDEDYEKAMDELGVKEVKLENLSPEAVDAIKENEDEFKKKTNAISVKYA
jgi:transketolase